MTLVPLSECSCLFLAGAPSVILIAIVLVCLSP